MSDDNGGGRLQADALFQGLSRPPMALGVSYMYFLCNAVICMMWFIWTQNFIVLMFVAPLVHLIGYLICMNEPRAVELGVLRLGKGTKCVNRRYHGFTNSYDVF